IVIPVHDTLFLCDDPATSDIYTLSLHDALPIWRQAQPDSGPRIAADLVAAVLRIRQSRVVVAIESEVELHLADAAEGVAQHPRRSEEHTSELQSRENLVCRLLLEKKKNYQAMAD